MAKHIPETYICPQCGTEVQVGTPSCPGCGPRFSEAEKEDIVYDGLNLPETAEEHSDFQEKVRRNKTFIKFVAGILLFLFVFGIVFKG
jgi:hypothetical protein